MSSETIHRDGRHFYVRVTDKDGSIRRLDRILLDVIRSALRTDPSGAVEQLNAALGPAIVQELISSARMAEYNGEAVPDTVTLATFRVAVVSPESRHSV